MNGDRPHPTMVLSSGRGDPWEQPATRSGSRAASATPCCRRSRGWAATTEPVETIMYGPLADQEAVHRLLIKLESLGLEVVEFRRLPGGAGDPGAAPPSL